MIQLTNSPITHFQWQGRSIFVKRDDLLNPLINGNKARKLAFLLQEEYSGLQRLISYGGSQSNMMYALAALAHIRGWQFDYHCRSLSQVARTTNCGNLTNSLALGMRLIEHQHNFTDFCQALTSNLTNGELLIRQGGCQAQAEYGLASLAQEINAWAKQQQLEQVAVFVASGTGTTAYYLQKHLVKHQVYTTNCVGSQKYLEEQWQQLEHLGPSSPLPIILPNTNYRFATPNLELLTTWQQIEDASAISFDLVYDPVAWHILLKHLPTIKQELIYIHCGGVSGNPSMLARYHHQNWR